MSFITLEGGEGVGKSTQAQLLATFLRDRGYEVVLTREPGGTAGAEAIRELLMTGEVERWSPRSEALLFAAARADHVERVIRPALARQAWVVCDRFVDSTRAYQSVSGDMTDPAIMMLHRIGSSGLLPHRTILLAAPPGVTIARRQHRGGDDRMEARDVSFHLSVSAAFEAFAEAESERWRRIDAAGSVDTVAAAVRDAIKDLL